MNPPDVSSSSSYDLWIDSAEKDFSDVKTTVPFSILPSFPN
jgi:hypothetical protein